jgi:hydrogenase-4 component F
VLKALSFGLLGFVAAERGSADIDRGPGLYGRSSALVFVFLGVLAASVGFPPFGIFASELTVLRAAFDSGHHALAIVVLIALGAVFGVLFTGALRALFARPDEPLGATRPRHGRDALWIGLPALAILVFLGVGMPPGLFEWLGTVAREISP